MKTTDEYIGKLEKLISDFENQEELVREISKHSDFKTHRNTLTELRKGFRENTIISLYTCWESYIKKVFFEIIFFHQDLLNNGTFFKKIVEKVVKKNHLASSFYDLDSSKMHLSKNVITHSSNMKISVLFEMISEFDFSKEDFYKYVELGIRAKDYPNVILLEEIRASCPQFEIDKNDNLEVPKGASEILKFYIEQIYMLVKFRNRLAHLDEVSTIWSMEEIQAMSKIIKSLMMTIDEYLVGQVLKKYVESSTNSFSFKEVSVTNAFPTKKVLEIDFESIQRGRKINTLYFFAKDRKENIYRSIKVEKMMNPKGNKCLNIPKIGKCSIEISCINLWNLKNKKEKLFIYEQVENNVPLILNVEVTDFY
ncbi:HEPN domain-containing protein [Listeria cossartiae subsp. cayugensis]|uniref:HEPN domain-containing protein n=1 Tax=Listeria cossartiae subsp. cayugensis TaxID=2713505 RepID=A0ABU2IQN7_9LIST|nr:HEPN domain-containing protein [Listeria cossartiae]MDT0050645.1 HEPN domain-containing protein [Listeria cossartiae subsp. cayugensis]MDT0067147.1 HEPN domain-containing protein [Listeria cossartiae subsp. cayugensis]MDT0080868.1 HEPN domain-containing protein [Listeria cossartiae subsp. cayugensis]MDT0083533.1 HEPN domain-containing protein [Listeria cossartiae subsp. cayugensis]MDT0089380.1 HEPN domain-containing protein [Listeria cossartiae subsp. cayugensis]